MVRSILFLLFISAWSFSYAMAASSPSIIKLMEKTAVETTAYILDSGKKGPTVFLIGGIHGDEPAGVAAAEKMRKRKPKEGRWVILPKANSCGLREKVRTSYFMEDLNRTFPGKKKGNDTEKLAFAIMELVKKYKPQMILDFHEAVGDRDLASAEIPNSIILGEEEQSAAIGLAALEKWNELGFVEEFTFLSGAPKGSLNREASKQLKIPVFTIETDKKEPLETRVKNQVEMAELLIEFVGREIP